MLRDKNAAIYRSVLMTVIVLFVLSFYCSAEELEENRVYKICIDPGHQGNWVDMSDMEPNGPGSDVYKAKATTGTEGFYTKEPEFRVNLDISMALRYELEQRGYQVVLTRESNDTAISNAERAQLATNEDCDISIRIHCNGSDDHSVKGALCMCPSLSNPYIPYLSDESLRLSEAVLQYYCQETGFSYLGVIRNDTMTGINWSTIPVTILEMGFMTNESDDRALQDAETRQKMVTGIANGIDYYFETKPQEVTQQTETADEYDNETQDYVTPDQSAEEINEFAYEMSEEEQIESAYDVSDEEQTESVYRSEDEQTEASDEISDGNQFESSDDTIYDEIYEEQFEISNDPLEEQIQQVDEASAGGEIQQPDEASVGEEVQQPDEASVGEEIQQPDEVSAGEEIQQSGEASAGEETEETIQTEENETVITYRIDKGDNGSSDFDASKQPDYIVELYEQFLKQREEMGERWAVSVENLSDSEIYDYRSSEVFQSASVIKVFIMGAVYDRMCFPSSEERSIPYNENYEGELRALLEQMITVSDNDAANELVKRLGEGDFYKGAEVVKEFCEEYGYNETSIGRMFLGTAEYGDNYTSARDCRMILSDIYHGVCVNEEASGKMMTILKNQERKWKLPAGLPSDFTSANKTGEMPDGYDLGCIENDMMIAFSENGDYIITVLSNDLGGRNEEAQNLITKISSFTAEWLQRTEENSDS